VSLLSQSVLLKKNSSNYGDSADCHLIREFEVKFLQQISLQLNLQVTNLIGDSHSTLSRLINEGELTINEGETTTMSRLLNKGTSGTLFIKY